MQKCAKCGREFQPCGASEGLCIVTQRSERPGSMWVAWFEGDEGIQGWGATQLEARQALRLMAARAERAKGGK